MTQHNHTPAHLTHRSNQRVEVPRFASLLSEKPVTAAQPRRGGDERVEVLPGMRAWPHFIRQVIFRTRRIDSVRLVIWVTFCRVDGSFSAASEPSDHRLDVLVDVGVKPVQERGGGHSVSQDQCRRSVSAIVR
jgi:hypothetical protein